jgi:hypothetical protein
MPEATFLNDPVIVHAAAAAVGIILIIGALGKLRDVELFRYAVENYGLLDGRLAAAFARGFPVFELLAGLALIPDATRPFGVVLALVVLAVATGGVALALLRGAGRIECGCGNGNQRISWSLVGRNVGLAAITTLAAADELPRSLGPVDYISVAGAILALLVVYAAANQLLANQPLLKELQS